MPKGAFTGTAVNYEAGRRLRERREALGMTQERLCRRIAADLGIFYDQSSISDWEHGHAEAPYAIAVWLENLPNRDNDLKKCWINDHPERLDLLAA